MAHALGEPAAGWEGVLRFLRSAGFRFALLFAGIFIGAAALFALVLWYATAGSLDRQTDAAMRTDALGLIERWRERPPVVVAGSALSAFGPALPCGQAHVLPEALPRATAMLPLAAALWDRGGAVDADGSGPTEEDAAEAAAKAREEALLAAARRQDRLDIGGIFLSRPPVHKSKTTRYDDDDNIESDLDYVKGDDTAGVGPNDDGTYYDQEEEEKQEDAEDEYWKR
jgi:hypothetical protein